MILKEKEIVIPAIKNHEGLLDYLACQVTEQLKENEIPIRFALTRTDAEGYHCELGTLSGLDRSFPSPARSIFDCVRRKTENTNRFTAALVVPTGIGAELGGHSGDAGPAARLLAAACDTLITHPNVVNAADINELPANALYVEGSVISRLLMGTVGLQEVRSNRVMMVIDQHEDSFFNDAAVNSVSAARAAMGLDCPLVISMADNILMRALYSRSGRAVGRVEHLERLCEVLEKYQSQYDAVALSSIIQVPEHVHFDYFHQDMINPWGGVEAMLTHVISLLYNIPSAHSPMSSSKEILDLDVGVVDPRKSAEAVSTTYLHCILKGLHKSPAIVSLAPENKDQNLLTVNDVSCLVIPDRCVGLPTLAALEQGIPVIAVRDKENCMQNKLDELPFQTGKFFRVNNYLEAVGVMTALKSGVAVDTVLRAIPGTKVVVEQSRVNDQVESGVQ